MGGNQFTKGKGKEWFGKLAELIEKKMQWNPILE